MTTTTHGWFYPATSYTSGWRQALQDQADAAEAAGFQMKGYRWADQTERDAETGMLEADLGWRTDNEIVYRYNGTDWKPWDSDWVTYTSTLSGFVVGTGGTNSTEYRYEGGLIRVRFLFKFGTSGQTFPTDPKFTLPVNTAAQSHTYEELFGAVSMHDNSAATLPRKGIAYLNATSVSQAILYVLGTATTGIASNITTTSPWTWAQNDLIRGELVYKPSNA